MEKEINVSLNILKKDSFSGSMEGMCYLLRKKGDEIEAFIWPGPFCFGMTKEEKESECFPFSDAGMESVLKWLEEKHFIYKKNIKYEKP